MLELLKIAISKNVLLEADLGKGLPLIQANPAQLRQVVLHLVTNASEAIGRGSGVVRVPKFIAAIDEAVRLEDGLQTPTMCALRSAYRQRNRTRFAA